MLAARRQFLSEGYYQSLATAVAAAAADETSIQSGWLEVGCGEGYYLSTLQQRGVPASDLWGIDIAKAAVQMAAQRKLGVNLAVAAARALPFFDHSFTRILSIFSPFDLAEIERVLRPGGGFIVVGPGEAHLREIKALIYASVEPHAGNFASLDQNVRWQETSRSKVQEGVVLKDAALQSLFRMTPYYWSATPAQQQHIETLSELEVTLDFELRCYEVAVGTPKPVDG